jgi:hypothetical protein
MTTEKRDEQDMAAKVGSQPGQGSVEKVLALSDDNHTVDQISELRGLINSLILAFETSQTRNTQNAVIKDAADEIKLAARVISTGSNVPGPRDSVVPKPALGERGCEGSVCECISSGCCMFEIVLDKVRASRPQKLTEIADSGDTALPVPTINAMEVQIYATVENRGILIPGLATTMDLRAAGGLSPGPGPWVILNRVVNCVQVKKGITKVVQLHAEVREHDEGVERPLGFKDELGEASGSITLNCCMPEIYPPMPLDVDLVHGGEGGGSVQLAFYARRVCC